MIFSTKGKDNWNALFSQLISAQEGEDVDAASLAQSYKTLTMSEKPKGSEQEESKEQLKKPMLI